jgi:hypothetical protein
MEPTTAVAAGSTVTPNLIGVASGAKIQRRNAAARLPPLNAMKERLAKTRGWVQYTPYVK